MCIQREKLIPDDVAMVEFCYDLENIIKEHDFRTKFTMGMRLGYIGRPCPEEH
jgi:hypothetical protein